MAMSEVDFLNKFKISAVTLTYAYFNIASGSGTITIPKSDYVIVAGGQYGDILDYSRIIEKGKSETWAIRSGYSATVSLDDAGTTVTYSGITQSGIFPFILGIALT